MTINKELKIEAEKYADDLFGFSNENHFYWEDCQRHFIGGIESKYVEKQKLEFAIKQLRECKKGMFTTIENKIKELEQQLKELENE